MPAFSFCSLISALENSDMKGTFNDQLKLYRSLHYHTWARTRATSCLKIQVSRKASALPNWLKAPTCTGPAFTWKYAWSWGHRSLLYDLKEWCQSWVNIWGIRNSVSMRSNFMKNARLNQTRRAYEFVRLQPGGNGQRHGNWFGKFILGEVKKSPGKNASSRRPVGSPEAWLFLRQYISLPLQFFLTCFLSPTLPYPGC